MCAVILGHSSVIIITVQAISCIRVHVYVITCNPIVYICHTHTHTHTHPHTHTHTNTHTHTYKYTQLPTTTSMDSEVGPFRRETGTQCNTCLC